MSDTSLLCKDNLPELLNEVNQYIAALSISKKRYLSELAPDFLLLGYFSLGELELSRIIADIINPYGTHGQGDKFLKTFSTLVGQEWIAKGSNLEIRLEYVIPSSRRLDIFITSSLGVVAIENKPWASDGDNQLTDYYSFLASHNNYQNKLLIFISERGPSEESIKKELANTLEKKGRFVHITYSRLCDWLDRCSRDCQAIVVSLFLKELVKHIRKNIIGELEMSDDKELAKLISQSPEKVAAGVLIARSLKQSQEILMEKLHGELDLYTTNKGYCLRWEISYGASFGKQFSGFGVKRSRNDIFELSVVFDSTGFFSLMSFGITSGNEDMEKLLRETMEKLFFPGKSCEGWPWYTRESKRIFDGHDYLHWDGNEQVWSDISSGKFSAIFCNLADKVFAEFGKINTP